ncbi:hypothetical protein COHA_002300 [Chlorella ohadii]|uniref:Uncharacterized protein n=1 Tax=Chlorella ohadii TaxID=2649997 RepID=A0AAD5DUB3_9CHLO|nr:hypothetical protein COHA_002300 [Chlorella ohadii]
MVAALVTATARPAVAGPPATVGRPQAARPRVPARPAFAAAQQQRRRRLAAPPRAAADEEDEFEDEEEDEEESDEEENAEMAPADEAWLQGALADARSPEPERRVLKLPFQRGLSAWEPAAAPQQLQQQADGAAAAVEATDTGRSEAAEMHELLQRLPGLQRSLRDAAQEGTGLLDLEAMKMTDYDVMRLPRKPEPELNEWDLRAKMEKRRRHEQETAEWNAARAAVGRYPSHGSDWRSDTRIQDTGDPTAPHYREWTHTQIWDLITLNGRNADPRDVAVWTLNPKALADAPAQDSGYQMDPEEYFASQGRLISEEDLQAIADSAGGGADADAILLSPDFDDFDPSLVGGFDGGFAAAGGGDGGGEDESF